MNATSSRLLASESLQHLIVARSFHEASERRGGVPEFFVREDCWAKMHGHHGQTMFILSIVSRRQAIDSSACGRRRKNCAQDPRTNARMH